MGWQIVCSTFNFLLLIRSVTMETCWNFSLHPIQSLYSTQKVKKKNLASLQTHPSQCAFVLPNVFSRCLFYVSLRTRKGETLDTLHFLMLLPEGLARKSETSPQNAQTRARWPRENDAPLGHLSITSDIFWAAWFTQPKLWNWMCTCVRVRLGEQSQIGCSCANRECLWSTRKGTETTWASVLNLPRDIINRQFRELRSIYSSASTARPDTGS